MISLIDIDFSKSSICESIITILKIVRKELSIDQVLFELNQRVIEAKNYISNIQQQKMKFEKVLYLFYHLWNFTSASGIYKLSDVLWIDNVLKTHKGTASSLGIIFLYIAEKLDLPVFPVIFPTQMILRVDLKNDNILYINPINGDLLNKHILKVWLKGNISPTAELYENDLNKADAKTVVRKMLDTLKAALIEEQKMELALNVSNVLLKIDPEDPYEIRDRGLIYAQLGCHRAALKDLIYFVEHCPEDPISEIIKVQIHSMEQKQTVLH